jgi:hypothetical protein
VHGEFTLPTPLQPVLLFSPPAANADSGITPVNNVTAGAMNEPAIINELSSLLTPDAAVLFFVPNRLINVCSTFKCVLKK